MSKAVKPLVIIGCILILLAVVLRLTQYSVMVGTSSIKPSSFLIVANTAFLLALLCKK